MNHITIFVLAGLIFSWIGDVSIEFSFIAGLFFFMAAQIMYFIAFFTTDGRTTLHSSGTFAVICVIVYGTGLISFLYRDLDGMRAPVIIYAIVILSMLTSAILRKGKVNPVSYWLVLSGALLFVLSDSTIAVNRFSFHFNSSDWVIMATYLLGQYFITMGYIRQHIENLT